MLYQESDLEIIVGGERTVAEGLGAQWVEGQGIRATRRAGVDGVWNHPEDMALPFPFTVKQFREFCDWHPAFEWEAIQAPFTNDDGTPDDAVLSELAARGTDAAELVRHMLGGLGDKADADTTDGMTTREIGAVFDGLPYKAVEWPKRVNGDSGSKWLRGARLSLGAKGGASAMWCPLRVAQAIHERAGKADKAKTLKTLNNRFKKNPALNPWKDAWDDFYSTFSDTD